MKMTALLDQSRIEILGTEIVIGSGAVEEDAIDSDRGNHKGVGGVRALEHSDPLGASGLFESFLGKTSETRPLPSRAQKQTRFPKVFKLIPVFETGPPVLMVTGPTLTSLPGRKISSIRVAPVSKKRGMTSRTKMPPQPWTSKVLAI